MDIGEKMTEEDRNVVLINCNLIEDLVYKIYVGKEEFNTINKHILSKWLQSIRIRVTDDMAK